VTSVRAKTANRIKTVSKHLLFDPFGLSAERKETPHIVERPRNWIGLKEALEAVHAPPEQEVTGSNLVGRTTLIRRSEMCRLSLPSPPRSVWRRQQHRSLRCTHRRASESTGPVEEIAEWLVERLSEDRLTLVKLLKSRMQAIEGGHSVARKDLRSRMRSALAVEVPARRSRRGSIPLPIESAIKKNRHA
jgi:hypothetical protein